MSFRQPCEACKRSRAAGCNHGAALLPRNQPGGLELFNSGRHPAYAALATGATRARRVTTFRIFRWLEVADFDRAFLLFFLCFCLHVTFRLFVVCVFPWSVLVFTDVLRKILGSLTREFWEFLRPRITRMSRMEK